MATPDCCSLLLPQEKRGYVEETRQQQQGALLQVVRCFVGTLSGGQGTAGEAMDTGGCGGGPGAGAGGGKRPE